MLKYLVAGLLAFIGPAYGADTKISALPAASTLTGVEAFPCVQSGVTSKCTLNQAATLSHSVSQGVFNVRTMYGAVPDGSTDNSTAITNAFTASNAFTVGIPTVYFDCDTSTTTCQYNYGGAGLSPVNPTRGTTIMCAPGVTLNYTGSAHAVDIGATGLVFNTVDEQPYRIQGCRWTGGASYTQGMYINVYITNTTFEDNMFYKFGNRTGFNIYYAGNNWESLVTGNTWFDDDGVNRNILDGHNTNVHAIRIKDNLVECVNATTHVACSLVVANMGVGFWIGDEFVVEGNVIQYHAPNLRLANTAGPNGLRPSIIGNHFESNNGQTTAPITYGDPGGTPFVEMSCNVFSGNTIYAPVAAGVPIVGPELPSSGTYDLAQCEFAHNTWTPAPSSGAFYIVTNGGHGNIWGTNHGVGVLLTSANTSPAVFDSSTNAFFNLLPYAGNSGSLANSLAAYDANGVYAQRGSFHNVAGALTCLDVSGSGTAQSCVTSPRYTTAGADITLSAGDTITYKTTTTNTGDLTILVNAASAIHVRKFSGTSVLSAGDIQAGVYYPLVYDGTYLEMSIPFPKRPGFTVATLPATAATGAVAGAQAYVTDATACTFQAAPTGGGSTYCPVNYTGAAWLEGG